MSECVCACKLQLTISKCHLQRHCQSRDQGSAASSNSVHANTGTHAFEQTWRWPDNSTAGADTYHNWAQGEPKNKDLDYYANYEDQRHAVMNGPGYYLESSGLWFTTIDDTWSFALCSVNAPTTAPTTTLPPTRPAWTTKRFEQVIHRLLMLL